MMNLSSKSYSSILYLRIPPGFQMILRRKDVQHHNIVKSLMMTSEVTYRPQLGADGVSKDSNIVAIVTMGFVKDAKAHIDVQGYNVYHKNRLIKDFMEYENFDKSLEYIEELMIKHAPIDGLLGFSQLQKLEQHCCICKRTWHHSDFGKQVRLYALLRLCLFHNFNFDFRFLALKTVLPP
ncbi:hypothetical protein L6452_14759 [Arctium lappa]|uniref:Uncharacterized protein n=1 Tax=Arctium lappa TaxID=4217 RepID=A0ACB9CME2_ARCLA|nr:hypothetical protein L6452_14759 [Arctium lappa]